MFRLVFKTSSGRITPSVAGSIPALSENLFFLKAMFPHGPGINHLRLNQSRNTCAMEKNNKTTEMRKLPSIDKVLHLDEVAELVKKYGRPLVTYAVREAVNKARDQIGGKQKSTGPSIGTLVPEIKQTIASLTEPSLKPVINATGIALLTHLGRAPLGERVLRDSAPIV